MKRKIGSKIVSIVAVFALSLVVMAGCGTQASNDGGKADDSAVQATVTTYPVTIENNGRSWTFESAPEKVAALDYTMAEYMCALGLQDKVISVAPGDYTADDVLAEYKAAVAAMPAFDKNQMTMGSIPTLELILAVEPDFVIGSSYSFFDKNCGAVENYIDAGINVYAIEGTCTKTPSLENVYTDLENLGKIFGVEDRAQELIDGLKIREAAIVDAVAGVDAIPVFANYRDQGDGTVYTVGGASFESYLISLAGGKNVFDDIEKAAAVVSDEQVIGMDAEFVIITTASESVGARSAADVWEGMQGSSLYADVPAVKNNKHIDLRYIEVQPALHAVDALEAMAKALHPDRVK